MSFISKYAYKLYNIHTCQSFSRFLTAISESEALEKDFKQLILKAKNLNIVDGTDIRNADINYASVPLWRVSFQPKNL